MSLWRRKLRSDALPLAEGLIIALQIPPGNGLVSFLAPGRARNNHEAVLYWVCERLESERSRASACLVERLGKQLRERLCRIQEVME
jgi:hypothetical protein